MHGPRPHRRRGRSTRTAARAEGIRSRATRRGARGHANSDRERCGRHDGRRSRRLRTSRHPRRGRCHRRDRNGPRRRRCRANRRLVDDRHAGHGRHPSAYLANGAARHSGRREHPRLPEGIPAADGHDVPPAGHVCGQLPRWPRLPQLRRDHIGRLLPQHRHRRPRTRCCRRTARLGSARAVRTWPPAHHVEHVVGDPRRAGGVGGRGELRPARTSGAGNPRSVLPERGSAAAFRHRPAGTGHRSLRGRQARIRAGPRARRTHHVPLQPGPRAQPVQGHRGAARPRHARQRSAPGTRDIQHRERMAPAAGHGHHGLGLRRDRDANGHGIPGYP